MMKELHDASGQLATWVDPPEPLVQTSVESPAGRRISQSPRLHSPPFQPEKESLTPFLRN